MTTFALVHGGWHGAWCWDRLVPLLGAAGHDTVAVDLPCPDVGCGASDYAAVVVQALSARVDDGDDDVVVVGHSLGGATIALVAEARPVRRLVYLCAAVPLPGRPLVDGPPPLREGQVATAEGTVGWTADGAIAAFYHDCPLPLARWAAARLRPQALTPLLEACPLARHPDVAVAYVLCREDRVTPPAWSRRAVPERLGVTPLELAGGHSPFLSRPGALAGLLVSLLEG